MGSDEAALENYPWSFGHMLPKVGSWVPSPFSRPLHPFKRVWIQALCASSMLSAILEATSSVLAVREGSPDYSIDIAEEVPASGRVACPVPFSPCQAEIFEMTLWRGGLWVTRFLVLFQETRGMQCGVVEKIEGHWSHPDPGLKSDSEITSSVTQKHTADSLNVCVPFCEMGATAPPPTLPWALPGGGLRQHRDDAGTAGALAHAVKEQCDDLLESPQSPNTEWIPASLLI